MGSRLPERVHTAHAEVELGLHLVELDLAGVVAECVGAGIVGEADEELVDVARGGAQRFDGVVGGFGSNLRVEPVGRGRTQEVPGPETHDDQRAGECPGVRGNQGRVVFVDLVSVQILFRHDDEAVGLLLLLFGWFLGEDVVAGLESLEGGRFACFGEVATRSVSVEGEGRLRGAAWHGAGGRHLVQFGSIGILGRGLRIEIDVGSRCLVGAGGGVGDRQVLKHGLQAAPEDHRVGDALVGVLFQKLADDVFEFVGDSEGVARNGIGLGGPLQIEHLGDGAGLERRAAGEQCEEDATETVEIGAGADRTGVGLFGGHVLDAAEHTADGGELCDAEQPGDAEVGELDLVCRE